MCKCPLPKPHIREVKHLLDESLGTQRELKSWTYSTSEYRGL